VIIPSFTFVSTANAFVLRGARPVFVDIRRDTLNIDEHRIEESITRRTKAIVVVHYAGVGCEMDTIVPIARSHGIAVVEDNAHGLFAEYRGRPLGTFGDVAALSFHETKNFTCGEGGAVLLNRDDLIDRAEIVREKGTDRSRFFRGQVDKYGWVGLGSSYLPSDLLAAFLLPQLERRLEIQASRQRIWSRYYEELGDWAARTGILLPCVPPHVAQAFHMFYLLMRTEHQRDALIDFLKRQRILATFHYLPLHASEFGRQFCRPRHGCPVSDDVSSRIVRLPFFTTMSDADQDCVIDAIHRFTG
jgi:dTDP-4-amino-4,6-dideoxygalactose transaminase